MLLFWVLSVLLLVAWMMFHDFLVSGGSTGKMK